LSGGGTGVARAPKGSICNRYKKLKGIEKGKREKKKGDALSPPANRESGKKKRNHLTSLLWNWPKKEKGGFNPRGGWTGAGASTTIDKGASN